MSSWKLRALRIYDINLLLLRLHKILWYVNSLSQFQREIHIPSLDTSVRAIIPAMVMQMVANMSSLFCGQHFRSVEISTPVVKLLATFHTCHQHAIGDIRLPKASQSTKWQGTIWSCFTIFLQIHYHKNRSVIFNSHNGTLLIECYWRKLSEIFLFSWKFTNIYIQFFSYEVKEIKKLRNFKVRHHATKYSVFET